MRLPEEIILLISKKLNAEENRNFSISCKKVWNVITIPSEKPYILESKINACTIRQLKHLVIKNIFYEPDFIAHVLKYALNLTKITLTSGKNYSIAFYQLFAKVTNSCLFLVPLDQRLKARMVIEEFDNKFLTVESNNEEIQADLLKTPEEVEKRIRDYKMEEKLKFLKRNPESAKMKNNLGHILNAHISRLITTEEYILLQEMPLVPHDMQKEQLHETVDEISTKFLESVAILEECWFMCTSFCCFFHGKNTDDCADGSRVGTQPKPVAFIRKKTRTGIDYFEYTIRFGQFELLATSGFFGVCESGDITPFFGSSVQNLPKNITERFDTLSSQSIFITSTAVSYKTCARLLNQYIKNDSANEWMYISQKFQNKGYEPAHPLTSDFANPTASVASMILRTFVYQRLDRKELERRLVMMKKTKLATKAAEIVLRYVEGFKSQEKIDFESYERLQLKKDMLIIYEGCIAGQLKSMNKKLFNKAKNEYEASKMNLFEDSSK